MNALPSIWELETFYSQRDVIIAGSGFAGLWSAWYLKKLRPDWNILIIEKDISPQGASTRNAGFACFGSVTELFADAKTFGEKTMMESFAVRFEGIRRILDIVSPQKIDYEAYGGYELITQDQYPQRDLLQDDIAWLNKVLQPITATPALFSIADEQLATFGFKGVDHLVVNNLEGQLHPAKLVAALTQNLQDLGVLILRGIELLSYKNGGDHVLLTTNQPVRLITKNLLVCTNLDAGSLTEVTGLQPARGQILLTSPIKNLAFQGSFHFDEGYYYFRNLGDRVLLGGARNKAFTEEATYDLSTSPFIQQELENFLSSIILPGRSYQIEHRWSGIMGMAPGSKTSIVQQLDVGCFCALALGGIGVAVGPVIGEQAARLIVNDGYA